MAQPRRLSASIAVLGVVSAAAVLLVPVTAALGDDPLLRLRSFGQQPAQTEVDCGSALRGLRASGGVTLYDLARDSACRDAASRRVAIAVAVAAVLVLTGFLGIAVSSGRASSAT